MRMTTSSSSEQIGISLSFTRKTERNWLQLKVILSKKKQAMIFKVDFEKAYEWDYLDDVLNKFGFGSKGERGFVIVWCLLKAQFLLTGVLQVNFIFEKNVVNADMFKGISASGLRMNLHKSKLIGISVKDGVVSRAAIKMGCSTLKTPFTYLGIKVGGSMARIRSWDEIVDKVKSQLSKWKKNTLSIGGRMTLLKSVLSSTPIYYMYMFKVPSQVLKCLEGIRHKFFIGADLKENKMSWFKWNKVLTSKDKGVIGVSSLFALNRVLLFKWVWRFHDNRSALWSRFIRTLHGNCGGLDKRSKAAHTSVWKSIITEVNSLRNKGVDLLNFMNKNIGKGIDTSFWEEIWRGDMNFKTKFPRVYALESDKKITVASKMNHNDVGLSLRCAPRDGVELEQFNSLNVFLAGTMLSDSNDRWSWSLVGSGEFLVASV
nr:RNA-directed DNA polymerase, eukaryota, reverse transcriptase zinc-binding domain protein [Tanacetum cinerariifolium]